ncbi:MAG: cbb3-type cytochrome c oxidase subunit I [Deltaproteobacteria bacterium]|nr:cbb3-type cytochrome c oxidase subunit I [Deltaproteobacteria bacterium]
MTTTVIDATTHVGGHAGHAHADDNYLTSHKGFLSWAFTLDHKRIGLMYLGSILFFFMIGGLLALGVRLELLTPKGDVFTDNTYNKVFTLHGAVMVFLFIVPSIPASFGNFFLPLMLGAKDVAFPRLNLLSFHIYFWGALILVYSIITGSIDTGWTFYTPYSTQSSSSVISATFGVFVLGFSSILTGLNFIVTVHKMRAPGQNWFRLPLFIWAIYSTSIIQVLATPVIAITLFLLIVEKALGIGIFDPTMGGDPVLYQHFFWFYSHPVVYVMILPAFGVISELITVNSRKNIFGYKAIAFSSVAIAFIGFLVWGHHLFVSGQSQLAGAIFSFLTFFVAVPTAIKVFSWVATMYKGSIEFTTGMVYALIFLFVFSIGGLTGLFLGSLATDVHLHDTYFVVAHFHYVMMGGVLMSLLGALHHWWPKMFGRTYNHTLSLVAAALVFIGFNMTFMAQFVIGTRGMPRRYHAYLPEFTLGHQISSLGSVILAAGLFLTLGYFIHSLFKGAKAEDNPWHGKSLEWATATPPITHNFHQTPIVTSGPYDFDEIERHV